MPLLAFQASLEKHLKRSTSQKEFWVNFILWQCKGSKMLKDLQSCDPFVILRTTVLKNGAKRDRADAMCASFA
eukprot:2350241-Amphidinium_carterae.1